MKNVRISQIFVFLAFACSLACMGGLRAEETNSNEPKKNWWQQFKDGAEKKWDEFRNKDKKEDEAHKQNAEHPQNPQIQQQENSTKKEVLTYEEYLRQMGVKKNPFEKAAQNTLKNMGGYMRLLADHYLHEATEWLDDKKSTIYWKVAPAAVSVMAGILMLKYIKSQWNKSMLHSSLIVDWSYRTRMQKLRDFFNPFAKKHMPAVKPIVFTPELKEEFTDLVLCTQNTHKRILREREKGKKIADGYTNVLLCGPSGVGKTTFLKKFIQDVGCMHYIHINGATFAKFTEEQGLHEIDALFKWALGEKSTMQKMAEFFYDWLLKYFNIDDREGLIIFIDEIDTLLPNRENLSPTDKAYKFLTAFLDHTGEFPDKFQIIGATNRKETLDPATWRRFHTVVNIPLPDEKHRAEVIKLYRDQLLLDSTVHGPRFIAMAKKHLTEAKIEEIAKQTDGFSHGDLETLVKCVLDKAEITATGFVSDAVINKVVEKAIKKQELLRTI